MKRRGSARPTARFTCAVCGDESGEVTLLKTGVLNPDVGDAPPGVAEMFSDQPRVLYRTILGRVETPISRDAARLFKAAIRARSASGIFDLDREALPFYCGRCEKTYCERH